jgi:uncharacterized protein YcgL (UPF0745 family)
MQYNPLQSRIDIEQSPEMLIEKYGQENYLFFRHSLGNKHIEEMTHKKVHEWLDTNPLKHLQ